MGQSTIKFRHGPLVAGVDLDHGRRADFDLIDLIWHYLRLNNQIVTVRNDGHDRFAIRDHPANRVDTERMND